MNPSVSVVVPTYNRRALLEDALARLLRQDAEHYEVLVVDDASLDDTPLAMERACAAAGGRLRHERLPENRGPAGARNAGWRAARGKWIAFTDDDCEPAAGWLRLLLKAAEESGADIVQGRTEPNPHHEVRTGWEVTRRITVLSERYQTCNLLVRRDVLDALDGFDESFPFAGEDTDFGWHAKASGYRATYASNALVFHAVRPCSFRQHLSDRAAWAELARLFKRHPDARMLLFGGLFYRRTHLTYLIGPPILALVGQLFGPVAPTALALGYLSRQAWLFHRTGLALRPAVARAILGAISNYWEIALFLRSSLKHRTLVL